MFLMTASPSFHTGVNEMYIVARGVLLGDCRVVVVVSSRKLPRTEEASVYFLDPVQEGRELSWPNVDAILERGI